MYQRVVAVDFGKDGAKVGMHYISYWQEVGSSLALIQFYIDITWTKVIAIWVTLGRLEGQDTRSSLC